MSMQEWRLSPSADVVVRVMADSAHADMADSKF
jgi:hypothetical protein